MNLETLSAIAQLVAALGVIASLFYLGAQIRQNTRSQRSVVVDSLTQALINLLGPQASDPDQMRAFVTVTDDWDGAAEADRLRALFMFFYHVQSFRECLVSAAPGNAGRRPVGELGLSYSRLLSSAGDKNMVVAAAADVRGGFSELS